MSSAPGSRPLRLLLVAAAGHGKTTALLGALPDGGVRVTAREALHGPLPGAPALGVDDLDELTPAEEAELARRLAALPPSAGLVLASRRPLGTDARRRLRGLLVERGPDELRLSPPQVARVLAGEYGVHDPETAHQVHACTAGWPALVHQAGEILAHEPTGDVRDLLVRRGSPAAAWLADQVLATLPAPAARALGVVAGLGPVSPRILTRVVPELDAPAGEEVFDRLRRAGVLVPHRSVSGRLAYDVVPAVAQVARESGDGAPQEALLRAAAAGYEEDRCWLAAARAWAEAGEAREARRLVHGHGEAMLRQGGARPLAALLADLSAGLPAEPSDPSDAVLRRTRADALRLAGEPRAALRELGPLVEAAGRDGWSRELATRVAAVHHTLGDYEETLRVLDLARPAAPPVSAGEEVEHVEWLAFSARARVMLGRRAEAERLARAALAAAERLGAPRAVAAAHVAMARVTDGARKEAHHEQARLAAAEEDDAVTVSLVLVNQTCLELASARFTDAVRSGREVARIAETCCPPGRRAAALHNLGEALMRTGELEEALWHLRRSVALARRLGSGAPAVGLLGVAEVHRQLGHDRQARAAYQEAVALARESQERQVLVPALAGAARTGACCSPAEALAAAEEALALATPSLRPFALTALGWVRLALGERPAAAESAQEAVRVAREVQALDLLAEALELAAACAADSASAAEALREALALWDGGGAAPGAARVQVLLGELDDADASARSRARVAQRRLEQWGIAGAHLPVAVQVNRTVRIAVLGRFAVTVDGAPVPVTAWRSRQARTLVKVLAARRGRPVTRERLCELLWPGDDPARTGHRLSVLLTTLRGVLDPGKRRPAEWYVAADLDRVWLDPAHCGVDADDLLRDADHAAELLRLGDEDRAAEVLAEVDATYLGEAFEAEQGEEWADALREEARAAWTRSVLSLVSLRTRTGRAGDCPRLLVRLLAADPYDEQAHRLLVRVLVRTGRHGEARRAFERWAGAMRAIDAPPPDPAVLESTPPRPRPSRTDVLALTPR